VQAFRFNANILHAPYESNRETRTLFGQNRLQDFTGYSRNLACTPKRVVPSGASIISDVIVALGPGSLKGWGGLIVRGGSVLLDAAADELLALENSFNRTRKVRDIGL
jgi:hypothetical protein